MHHKFHNYGPGQSGAITPPTLVRMQGKQGSVNVHGVAPGAIPGGHLAPTYGHHHLPSLAQVRPNEVVSVSSSTHPLQEPGLVFLT